MHLKCLNILCIYTCFSHTIAGYIEEYMCMHYKYTSSSCMRSKINVHKPRGLPK